MHPMILCPRSAAWPATALSKEWFCLPNNALLFSSPFPAASSLLLPCCSSALLSLLSLLSGVRVDIGHSRHSPYYSTLIHSFPLSFPFFPWPSELVLFCPVFRCQPSNAKKSKSPAFLWPFFSVSFLPLLSLAWLNFFCLTCPRAWHSMLPPRTHTILHPSIPSHSFGFWLSLCCI